MTRTTKLTLIAILGASLALFGCDDDNGDDDAGTDMADSGGGGTDSGPDEDAGGGGDTPTCAAYCDNIDANCAGRPETYADRAECMDICMNFGWETGDPVTVSGPADGNSIGCRTYHGGAPAGEDADLHCPHAGYTGAATCGDWCEVYCAAALQVCTGSNALYADMAECMTACSPLDDTADIDVTDGDSVQCRLYHLSAAVLEDDPALHCPHAAEDGGGVCVGGWSFRTDAASAYTRVDHAAMPAVPTVLAGTVTAGDAATLNTVRNSYADLAPDTSTLLDATNGVTENLTALHSVLSDDLVIDSSLTTCATYSTAPSGTAGSSTAGTADDVSACITQVQSAAGVIPDVISVDRTSTVSFPNGRDLTDPVIDVTLAVILLDLGAGSQSATTLADIPLNPSANDVSFSTDFPYLAEPHAP